MLPLKVGGNWGEGSFLLHFDPIFFGKLILDVQRFKLIASRPKAMIITQRKTASNDGD